MTDLVRVALSVEDGVPFGPETCWAFPVEADAGLYRLDNVLLLAEHGSLDDVVQCERSPDGRLVAVTLVERSRRATVVFGVGPDKGIPREQVARRIKKLVKKVEYRFKEEVSYTWFLHETGPVGFCLPADRVDELLAIVADEAREAADRNPIRDDDDRSVGAWTFYTQAHPDMDVPVTFEGSSALLDT